MVAQLIPPSTDFTITPPDPTDRSCVLFNVTLEKKIINTSTKKRLFYANVWYCFKVRNNGEMPTTALYFMLIDSATKSFEIKYKEKTAGTIITGRPTTTTPYDVLLPSINETISFWNMNHRNASLN